MCEYLYHVFFSLFTFAFGAVISTLYVKQAIDMVIGHIQKACLSLLHQRLVLWIVY